MESAAAALPDLTPQCLSHVFSYLSSRDIARASCVQKLWRDLIQNDEDLWKRHLEEDFGLETKKGADRVEKRSYREAYGSWRSSFGPEYWPYLPRAVKAWQLIEDWLATHFPEVLATLQDGLSEAELAEAEACLGFPLPPALKVLYRLHNGQLLHIDVQHDQGDIKRARARAAATRREFHLPSCVPENYGTRDIDVDGDAVTASLFHGLFGGYCVYNHLAVCRMLPLQRAVLQRHLQDVPSVGPQLLPFACSFQVVDKMFLVDCGSGALSVKRNTPHTRPVLRPATPPDVQPGAPDGVLRWFEEYARRLAGGWYHVTKMDEEFEESRGITLFPLVAPGVTEAVTRGVRVRASVAYVPEGHPTRHMFAYSIHFSLLGEAELQGGPAVAAADAVKLCQLESRHWVIRGEQGEVKDEIRGDGVIGKYPVLQPGGQEFVYCSCTHQDTTRGSMEGDFEFVEGTLESPQGASFTVVCPPFRLDVPQYVF